MHLPVDWTVATDCPSFLQYCRLAVRVSSHQRPSTTSFRDLQKESNQPAFSNVIQSYALAPLSIRYSNIQYKTLTRPISKIKVCARNGERKRIIGTMASLAMFLMSIYRSLLITQVSPRCAVLYMLLDDRDVHVPQ